MEPLLRSNHLNHKRKSILIKFPIVSSDFHSMYVVTIAMLKLASLGLPVQQLEVLQFQSFGMIFFSSSLHPFCHRVQTVSMTWNGAKSGKSNNSNKITGFMHYVKRVLWLFFCQKKQLSLHLRDREKKVAHCEILREKSHKKLNEKHARHWILKLDGGRQEKEREREYADTNRAEYKKNRNQHWSCCNCQSIGNSNTHIMSTERL